MRASFSAFSLAFLSTVEGWKDGRMEGWKDGRMEGWKDGRMVAPPKLLKR
jgi:hypothetical protein